MSTSHDPGRQVAAGNPWYVSDQFADQMGTPAGRKLVEEHRADVIIPTGISQCPVHIDPKWAMKQIGVPIVEGIGAPIRLAAMFADLGLTQSRARWPKSRAFEGK